MGKVKVHRASTSIDMTPMVDLAFLLVTFFMLTATATPDEPVTVDMPTSVSEIPIPDINVLTISVGKDGKVYFNMDGKYNREALLGKIGERYNIQFTEEETKVFAVLSSTGIPIGNLKQFLSMKREDRSAVTQPGIPCDSVNNELKDWIIFSRMTNPKLRIAIKGDSESNYPVIKQVIKTLIDNKVFRFNLITNMEKGV
ncbi:MAG: biopolymer transporter ExbD [Chryseolinea sp.]